MSSDTFEKTRLNEGEETYRNAGPKDLLLYLCHLLCVVLAGSELGLG